MKSLSDKLKELSLFIEAHEIRSVSFDIDGTLYPLKTVEARWRKNFFRSPIRSLRFLQIRKKWENRRKGQMVEILPSDVAEFETYLESLLDETLVPLELRLWLRSLQKDVYFLTDHGGAVKLRKLGLEGTVIDCLKETQELKPHPRISEILKGKYGIVPERHLHLGDRWTDEAQAKLLGSYFQYLKP
ncbi:HAD family hydrolase [Peredibacter starrii]|uniref:Uncharacterized protein n=1 Tax=Peredibacter starrii TaxID=28202 RepID=A0AAX4HUN8_9BACT|nr:hypothetical protein [Peredibacter starrii]WPU66941.1 hypothetical protein SOO65_09280 [Peredibacter starrii]